MVREARREVIRSDKDLLRILEDVRKDKQPRIVERAGERLAAIIDVRDLDRVLTAEPSSEEVEVALRAAGSWHDVDADALKRYIYEGRKRGSRPISRPA